MVLNYCVGDWVSVLIAPSHWVLAVETSGASTALVTSRDTQHLHQLVGQVVKAIENPDIEFQVRVEVSPEGAQTIDESLPVLAPGASVQPGTRTRALMAVAGVAATAGALGVPIAETVNRVLELLGAR